MWFAFIRYGNLDGIFDMVEECAEGMLRNYSYGSTKSVCASLTRDVRKLLHHELALARVTVNIIPEVGDWKIKEEDKMIIEVIPNVWRINDGEG